ncbi:MAG: hypothetical protein GX357_07095, partial [Firmicutes bacterium]|nr:hypothetical protein [Bacillota bacterium]
KASGEASGEDSGWPENFISGAEEVTEGSDTIIKLPEKPSAECRYIFDNEKGTVKCEKHERGSKQTEETEES